MEMFKYQVMPSSYGTTSSSEESNHSPDELLKSNKTRMKAKEVSKSMSDPDTNDHKEGDSTSYMSISTDDHPKTKSPIDILYAVDDVPPWYLCIILGFQHFLTMFCGTLVTPLLLTPYLCTTDGLVTAELLSTLLFVSGLATLLQCTFGSRLPIVQGGSNAFLLPIFSIMSLPKWKCPAQSSAETAYFANGSVIPTVNMTLSLDKESPEDLWKPRMREIQGAIIVASFFEVILGCSGAIGWILNFIGPLTTAPTIILIGLSLFRAAANSCAFQWWIALLTVLLITIVSQYLSRFKVPCFGCGKDKDKKTLKLPIFELFPVIIAIIIVWVLCAIFTVTNVFPANEDAWGYRARTDIKSEAISRSKWFFFPYPGQWGMPTVSLSSVLGMFASVIASVIESIGDYYACARISGAPTPPIHAVNRGIMFEGIGCTLAGLYGCGIGLTSFSQNIGAIGITKVGSRRVVQICGIFLLILGLFGKFGAFFMTLPEPIVGGVFIVAFGMIVAIGISNLQFVDLNSSRNLYIIGLSVFLGITIPEWVSDEANEGSIDTGVVLVDEILTILCRTSMLLGGLIGFILDNTIPGSYEERGMVHLLGEDSPKVVKDDIKDVKKCYDFPIGMKWVNVWRWTRRIPICPTYEDICGCRKKNLITDEESPKSCDQTNPKLDGEDSRL